jgi:hypothetical protein
MTLDIVDPLAWVKRNQMRFFPGGQVDVIRLLAYVMSDVLELGRGECRIVQRDGWWFVTSDVDWLAQELSVRDLFERVVPAPQHGEHSMRAEVLVNAFAQDVLVFSAGEATEIKGRGPEGPVIERVVREASMTGMIAFRLSP